MMKKYSARLDRFDGTKRTKTNPTEAAFLRLLAGDGQKNYYTGTGTGGIGRRNCYGCPVCRGSIITVDEAEGVTPFMVKCRLRRGCCGMMQSWFYRGVPLHRVPTHAWRPSMSGGDSLTLHELSPEERAAYATEPRTLNHEHSK